MKMVKSLILGSAAGLVAMSGAQAADLPVKAKAVEYVRICSLYGAGFYYIPGTDTCIKLGGYIHAETQFNGNGVTNGPNWTGAAGQANRTRHLYQSRSRGDLNIDTRTATEYGVVRTFFDATFTWTSGTDGIAGGSLGVYHAFIQFAGFTMGKTISQFTSPWGGGPGNNTSYLIGGDDTATGVGQLAYTAQFGNGVSASISLEDQAAYRNSQLLNTGLAGGTAATWFAGNGPYATTAAAATGFGGNSVPDIVGQVRVDQAWGLLQFAAAAHNIHASYYTPTNETTGHPSDTWGFAVQGSLSIKNIPTGAGDSINLDAGYANGATRYILGGVSPNAYAMYGGSSAAYQSIGIGASSDGVFTNGGSIEKTSVWGVRGAFNHNWNPNWASSVFGSYTSVMYSGNGKTLYCAGFGAAVAGQNVTYTCNPDFAIAQVGFRTIWTPVKNLSISGEVVWQALDQKMSGVTGANVTPASTKPNATYEFKDQNTVVVGFRARRNF
jgi:hypothetical protein